MLLSWIHDVFLSGTLYQGRTCHRQYIELVVSFKRMIQTRLYWDVRVRNCWSNLWYRIISCGLNIWYMWSLCRFLPNPLHQLAIEAGHLHLQIRMMKALQHQTKRSVENRFSVFFGFQENKRKIELYVLY